MEIKQIETEKVEPLSKKKGNGNTHTKAHETTTKKHAQMCVCARAQVCVSAKQTQQKMC